METKDGGSRDGEFMYVQNVTYGEYILHLHFLVTTKSKIFLHAGRFMRELASACLGASAEPGPQSMEVHVEIAHGSLEMHSMVSSVACKEYPTL